jgi:hypothetical protein
MRSKIVMAPRSCGAAIIVLLGANAAQAQYPVAGRWTYENVSASGPAPSCGARYMEFRGGERFDTGGGVPAYRNVSVAGAAPSYRVVDEFFTVQIRARMSYTLRMIDEDHIEIVNERGGRIRLRRCRS